MQRNVAPHAKPGATRHGLRQARQVGPDIFVEFTDNKISPVTTRPFWRWFLEIRPALAAPGAEERSFFRNTERRLKKISVKHVVIIHKDQEVPCRLANPAKARRCKAECLLSNKSRVQRPRKITAVRDRFVASIIHHHQFPAVGRESLAP